MGCEQSKPQQKDGEEKKREKDMHSVGPEGKKQKQTPDDNSTKPATPKPKEKETKTKVSSRVEKAMEGYDEEDDDGGQNNKNPLRRPGEEMDDDTVTTLMKPKTAASSMAAFKFGDNSGVEMPDQREEADAVSVQQTSKRSRRVGVSAEPILPDAAEKFEPRVIPKSNEMKQLLINVTKFNPLFKELEPEELSTVIDAMEEESFPKGADVLTEGEIGTEKFYFIAKGKVDILREEEGYICSFVAGQTFGEMELMYLQPCAATVRCVEAVDAYSIDRDTYRHIVMMVSIRKRRLYKELLSHVEFLSSMSDYEAMTLADALEPVTFKPGDIIVKFGSEGEWMHIIVNGEVKVVGRDEKTGEPVDVCTFGPGETVGELEFLNKHRVVADVIATTETKTCRLHREHFEMCMGPVVDFLKANAKSEKYGYYQSVVTTNEATGEAFAHFTFGEQAAEEYQAFATTTADDGASDENTSNGSTAQHKTRRQGVSDETMENADEDWVPPVVPKSDEDKTLLMDVLRANPLLGALEEHDLEVVAMAMEKKKFAAHTMILEQGSEGGEHYFVIAAGTVEIIKNGEFVCTFGQGQGFGEMELMYIQPCVATVKARNDVTAWALDRTTYKRLVMQVSVKRRELYTELLSGVEFLERLTEYEKGTLADALAPYTFPQGSYIIHRGERSEWMYIVVSGSVEVMGIDEATGGMKHVCFLERGACVGELEFLNQHLAVADCIAKTEVRTCKLHRDHFELCMGPIMDVLRKTVRQEKYKYYNAQLEDISASCSPPDRRRRGRAKAVSAEVMAAEDLEADYTPPVIEKEEKTLEELQLVVARCPLFSALGVNDRRVVIDALEPVSFSKGHVISQEGEVYDDNYWYIIACGAVTITQEGNIVATFSIGQSFGELELMYTTPATTTTVVSTDDFHAFRLDRRSYRKIVLKVCTERRKLYKELLGGIPFLSSMSDTEQLALADALSPAHFAPGDVMINVGDHNEWMHIIVDGVVEVFGKDGSKVCELRRGEMVGELEFLNKHAAVANCVSKTHVQTCRLHRAHFEMCMGPVTDFIVETTMKPKYSYYRSIDKND